MQSWIDLGQELLKDEFFPYVAAVLVAFLGLLLVRGSSLLQIFSLNPFGGWKSTYHKRRLSELRSSPFLVELSPKLRVESLWETTARDIELWPDEPRSSHGVYSQDYTSLDQLLEKRQDNAILLTGAAGSGKTTLLRQLERTLHESKDSKRIPIYIDLSRYPSSGQLLPWIEQQWKQGAPKDAPKLSDLLNLGKVLFLLDGMNEMPPLDESPTSRFLAVSRFVRSVKSPNRIILASRSVDVQGLFDIARIYLEPLSEEKVREYLQKVAQQRSFAATAYKRIQSGLIEHSIQDVYQYPFGLSLLSQVLGEEARIPRDLPALISFRICKNIVEEEKQGTRAWGKIKELFALDDLTLIRRAWCLPPPQQEIPGSLLFELGNLAFTLQRQEPGRWFIFDKKVLETILGDTWHTTIMASIGAKIVEEVSGLDGRSRSWRFVHQLYQEYFAARAWVRQFREVGFDFAHKAYYAKDSGLRPTLRSLYTVAGKKGLRGVKPGITLPVRPSSSWEDTASMALSLAGKDEGFLDGLIDLDLIRSANAALTGRCVSSADQKTRIRQKLLSWYGDVKVELRARVEAGLAMDEDALSSLGYEIKDGVDGVRYWWPPQFSVASAKYAIGAQDKDKDATEFERPLHNWSLDKTFNMSKYPITRAEFTCFVDAKGYENSQWWPQDTGAAAWVQGQSNLESYAVIIQEVLEWSDLQFSQYSAKYAWSEEEVRYWTIIRSLPFEQALKKHHPEKHPGILGHPMNWQAVHLSRPLQPVVGLCWYEAQAYALWLSHVSSQKVALPLEQEWEAAARVQNNKKWAYGDKFDPMMANTAESGFRRPTPVGVYSAESGNELASDFTGNVNEWTDSVWRPNYEPSTAIDSTKAVIRGGSWEEPSDLSRLSSRMGIAKDSQRSNIGFRILTRPSNFEAF